MGTKLSIEKIKENVLVGAIPLITILNVEEKKPFDGNIALYITTDDISTIDFKKLREMLFVNSTEKILINHIIPETKCINGEHVKNTDTICIFLDEI